MSIVTLRIQRNERAEGGSMRETKHTILSKSRYPCQLPPDASKVMIGRSSATTSKRCCGSPGWEVCSGRVVAVTVAKVFCFLWCDACTWLRTYGACGLAINLSSESTRQGVPKSHEVTRYIFFNSSKRQEAATALSTYVGTWPSSGSRRCRLLTSDFSEHSPSSLFYTYVMRCCIYNKLQFADAHNITILIPANTLTG